MVPLSGADTALPTGTTLTSDEIDALGIPWGASLEDWSTALDPPKYQCTGVLPPGIYQDVTVPPGVFCDINSSNYIAHDVTVLEGASLLDGGTPGGAYIGHDLRAKKPASIIVESGTVEHDIHIQGTTGASAFHNGENWICNQRVGHDVVVQKSAITAAPWVIGDNGTTFFARCGNSIAHDLVVKDNADTVDISGNNPANGIFQPAGIGHDVAVEHNSGGTTVNFNTAGHDCKQSDNSPYTGNGNVAANDNNCNATY
jgi:hypothetical protein